MTDDEDRTQEIHRDGDRARSASDGRTDRFAKRTGNTPPFGTPAAAPQRTDGPAGPAGHRQPAAQPAPAYRPAPGYQQAPSPAYGAPMLPADRGSGGFPAALVGAVVAALVAVGTAYAGYQSMLHDVARDGRSLPGFFVVRLGLLPWPSGSGDRTTAFLAGLVVVLLVSLLLMMAAAMSTRAGTGGFGLFLGAWMAVVIAGAAAAPAVAAIALSDQLSLYVANYVSSGMEWGVLYGWIPALVLLIAHAMRRKPVAR